MDEVMSTVKSDHTPLSVLEIRPEDAPPSLSLRKDEKNTSLEPMEEERQPEDNTTTSTTTTTEPPAAAAANNTYAIENCVTKERVLVRRNPETIEELQEEITKLTRLVIDGNDKARVLLGNVAAARAPFEHSLFEPVRGMVPPTEEQLEAYDKRVRHMMTQPVAGIEAEEHFEMSHDPERVFQSLAMLMDDLEYLFIQGHCGARLLKRSFRPAVRGRKDHTDLALVHLYVCELNKLRSEWILRTFQLPTYLAYWRAVVLTSNRLRDAALQKLMEKYLEAPPLPQQIRDADASEDLKARQEPAVMALRQQHQQQCEALVRELNERDPEHKHEFWRAYSVMVNVYLKRAWDNITEMLVEDEMFVRACFLEFLSSKPQSRYEAILLQCSNEDHFRQQFVDQIEQRARSMASLCAMFIQQISVLDHTYVEQCHEGRLDTLLETFPQGPYSDACMLDKMHWVCSRLTQGQREELAKEVLKAYKHNNSSAEEKEEEGKGEGKGPAKQPNPAVAEAVRATLSDERVKHLVKHNNNNNNNNNTTK